MTGKQIYDAFGGIDEELLEMSERKSFKTGFAKRRGLLIGLAACIAVFAFGTSFLLNNLRFGKAAPAESCDSALLGVSEYSLKSDSAEDSAEDGADASNGSENRSAELKNEVSDMPDERNESALENKSSAGNEPSSEEGDFELSEGGGTLRFRGVLYERRKDAESEEAGNNETDGGNAGSKGAESEKAGSKDGDGGNAGNKDAESENPVSEDAKNGNEGYEASELLSERDGFAVFGVEGLDPAAAVALRFPDGHTEFYIAAETRKENR